MSGNKNLFPSKLHLFFIKLGFPEHSVRRLVNMVYSEAKGGSELCAVIRICHAFIFFQLWKWNVSRIILKFHVIRLTSTVQVRKSSFLQSYREHQFPSSNKCCNIKSVRYLRELHWIQKNIYRHLCNCICLKKKVWC